jgi:hypothetical protein
MGTSGRVVGHVILRRGEMGGRDVKVFDGEDFYIPGIPPLRPYVPARAMAAVLCAITPLPHA